MVVGIGDGEAAVLTQQLLEKGVIVRPMGPWGVGADTLRVSVGLPEKSNGAV